MKRDTELPNQPARAAGQPAPLLRTKETFAARLCEAGQASLTVGRYLRAAAEFEQAVELCPSLVAARMGQCLAYAELNLSEELSEAVSGLLALKPEEATAQFAVALLLHDSWEYGAALWRLRRVVELLPEESEAHYALGRTLIALREYEEAAAALEQALRLSPQYQRASLYWMRLSRLLDQAALPFAFDPPRQER